MSRHSERKTSAICISVLMDYVEVLEKQLAEARKSSDVPLDPWCNYADLSLLPRLVYAEKEAAERTTETNEMRHSLEYAQRLLTESQDRSLKEILRLRSELERFIVGTSNNYRRKVLYGTPEVPNATGMRYRANGDVE